MNIHLQVSDDQERTLTLDGDLDLLDQLLATIRVALDDRHSPRVSVVSRPISSTAPRPVTSVVPKSVGSVAPKPMGSTAKGLQQTEALEDLSPIAKCYQIAAARGRALRLAREQANAIAGEDSTRDESSSATDKCAEE